MAANTITTSDGWSYRLTPEDKLWAARMIWAEGGDPKAVLWTMASRAALYRSPSFTTLLRNYSQPINPIWQRDGEKCRPGGPYAGTPHCSETKLARRARASSLTPEEMPQQVAVVEAWSRGAYPNPVPRAVHFADATVSQSCLETGDCSRLVARLGGNWHLANERSDRWPASYVEVAGARDGASSWIGLVLGLAGAFYFWRFARGVRFAGPPRGKPPTQEEIDAFWTKIRADAAKLPPAAEPALGPGKPPWQRRGPPPTQEEIDRFWAKERWRRQQTPGAPGGPAWLKRARQTAKEARRERERAEAAEEAEEHYLRAKHL